jgi:glycosyltransferase involved in cell wall biosynthesis
MKKIAIIGSVGLPAKYGGWETLVDHLTRNLRGKFEFTIYCSAKKYAEKQDYCNGAHLVYINLDANGVQSILYDIISILKARKFADTLLILGVSGCLFLPIVKLISKNFFIVNIDGLEWRRAKWGRFAKWFLKLSEAVAVRFADVVVTDNKAIQEYVVREYDRESVLIAYGGDHAVWPLRDECVLSRYGVKGRRYAFKVCRIEPENNIDLIIRSFETYRCLDLVIVGNWNNSDYGIGLRKNYGLLAHVHLLDPIYDHDILNQMRTACHVYVHGHSAGGTNPSLVEAMSLGLPVVAYGCVFNRETTCDQALFFNSTDELVSVLTNLNDELLAKVGANMKKLASQMYTWDKISSSYAELF